MTGLGLRTLNDVLIKATSRGAKPVMMYQDATGAWLAISSDQLYGKVRALASVLKAWGVGKGDRVVLLSENRWEWAVSDFAILALGGVDVPIYSTLSAESVGYMLRDSGAKVAILSSKEQYDKLSQAGEIPDLEHVVVMDEGEFGNAESFRALLLMGASLQEKDPEFEALLRAAAPEDLATLIYTSGTTGTPKGVMLTHGNLAANINLSCVPYKFTEVDSCISFLPLSHVMARHLDYALMHQGARIAYCPKFDGLPAAMKALQPTIFVAVPRVYEKIRQGVEAKSAQSGIKRSILGWAISTGSRQRDKVLAGKKPGGLFWKLAHKLVYSKIHDAFGGKVRVFVSGSAPLGMDSANWFADAGMRIFEGYGLTETSPVISLNYPEALKIGTIGKPLENVEVRFAEDGEIEVRGPSIFPGYWQNEKETAANFHDGWFKTGDIGQMDADGFLSITDRKKDILKTSGGKMIAPQPIEGKLKANAMVAHAALVGENHKFACVLISPNFHALEGWARGKGIATGDHAALVKDPKVKAEYERIVEGVNKTLSHHETLKRVTVVPEEWTIETGELTPSMKMKRKVVEKKYEAEIAEFYKDEASSKG